ncbi:hypothetical protein CaCOL14_007357 [Colletotrichum acutatum]
MAAAKLLKAPSVFATFIRGGTSKALFFHAKDLPESGIARDRFLIRVMGSPDPGQIDGMGGGRIVISKVAIVQPSERPDADVDYTFAQVGLDEATVSYDANCGNISAGVGPFAINEGLLKTDNWQDRKRVDKIYNTGTDAILTATPERMLPTGNPTDTFKCTFGMVEATYCEVGNAIVFIAAQDLGIQGNETVSSINSNSELIARVREVRGRISEKLGRCKDWNRVDEQSPMLPMVASVSKPTSEEGDIQARLFLDNHCHPSMAGTGGVCTTAASRIEGSVLNRLLSPATLACGTLKIQHPAGHLPMSVKTIAAGQGEKLPAFSVLGFVRTARYIFQGQLFVPSDI